MVAALNMKPPTYSAEDIAEMERALFGGPL